MTHFLFGVRTGSRTISTCMKRAKCQWISFSFCVEMWNNLYKKNPPDSSVKQRHIISFRPDFTHNLVIYLFYWLRMNCWTVITWFQTFELVSTSLICSVTGLLLNGEIIFFCQSQKYIDRKMAEIIAGCCESTHRNNWHISSIFITNKVNCSQKPLPQLSTWHLYTWKKTKCVNKIIICHKIKNERKLRTKAEVHKC